MIRIIQTEMKNLLLIATTLLGFVGSAFAQFPNTSVSSGRSGDAIVLSYKEMLGNGVPRQFNIPYKRDPSFDTLNVRLFTRQWTRLGGQNRSNHVHPGFDDPFYGENPELGSATAGLNQYFIDSNGATALPSSWNAHMVLFEWGPTLPAPNPADWIPMEDWDWACENNPTCYWGAATYDTNRSFRDTWREYDILESEPWYHPGLQEGNTIYYVPVGFWNGGEWDGSSHEWPIRIDWRQTTILWLTWQ
jgi:hypothetical protein